MEWKMVDLEERTDWDRKSGFYRYKVALFMVNGTPHTLRISMPDFDTGKTQELVKKEAEKIMAAIQGKK